MLGGSNAHQKEGSVNLYSVETYQVPLKLCQSERFEFICHYVPWLFLMPVRCQFWLLSTLEGGMGSWWSEKKQARKEPLLRPKMLRKSHYAVKVFNLYLGPYAGDCASSGQKDSLKNVIQSQHFASPV